MTTPGTPERAPWSDSAAMASIAAGVAQEIRNPLLGISSAAQLLRYRLRDDPVVEKNVGRILREVERLNGLVTSLLDYGQPAPLRLAPHDPDAIWDEVLDAQRGLLESRSLHVKRTRAHPRAHLRTDATQLAQLFVQLLANAADHAPEGSDLTLDALALPGGGWRCRLHNAGPAIPADALPRVFDLFFTTRPGAAGIGLALCRRIVEAHGGTIEIESAPESGTAVVVSLP